MQADRIMLSSGKSKKRAAKVGHTKSRAGCGKCRERRVRCDQASPECGNCARLGLECIYGEEKRRSNRLNFKNYSQSSSALPKNQEPTQDAYEHGQTTGEAVAESKQRRLMELRLLHHWMAFVTRPFLNTPSPRWGELWRMDLPLIAFQSDAVLHALLAMSATHLLRTIPENGGDHGRLLQARDQYLVIALREQRAAPEDLHADNVDELSFAALLITLNAFSMLRERAIGAYEPPMTWLEMGRGAGSVMRKAAELMGKNSGAKLGEIIRITAPIYQDFERQELDESVLQPYKALLGVVDDQPDDPDSPDARDVYRQTIAYIASFRSAIQSGEPPYVHLRRICMFPFTVPARFTELVGEGKPLAWIVLAHFFAVISHTEALRYLGNTGDDITTSRREVVAIHEALPQQWHRLMIWPMDEVRAEQ